VIINESDILLGKGLDKVLPFSLVFASRLVNCRGDTPGCEKGFLSILEDSLFTIVTSLSSRLSSPSPSSPERSASSNSDLPGPGFPTTPSFFFLPALKIILPLSLTSSSPSSVSSDLPLSSKLGHSCQRYQD